MNSEFKILILEDDAEERKEFETCIKDFSDITIIGCTANANEALNIVSSEHPDAIIIDLELHNGIGNGLQFLSDLNHTVQKKPFLLITTNNSSHTTHEAARSLGADFILTKYERDYSAAYVLQFLKMMHATIHNSPKPETKTAAPTSNSDFVSASAIPESDLITFIREELIKIGINPKSVGFQYLADAVLIKVKNPRDNIYTVLGPKYKKSDPSIERAMQYSINRAWRTGDPDELLVLYTARINSDRGVPTIMEFIYFYVSKVQNYFKIK